MAQPHGARSESKLEKQNETKRNEPSGSFPIFAHPHGSAAAAAAAVAAGRVERKERGRAQKQVAKSGQPGRALAAGRCRSSAGRGPAVLLTLRGKPAAGIGCTGKPYREEASEVD